jgi:hypothetical protein
MSEKWRENTILIAHESEAWEYGQVAKNYKTKALFHDIVGIDQIRRRIGKLAAEMNLPYFFMLDDDFLFHRRASEEVTNLVPQSPEDFDEMMEYWEKLLNFYPMTGVCFRAGNHIFGPAKKTDIELNCRIHGAMGFKTEFYNSVPDQNTPFLEDFAVVLWGLTNGYENAKLMYWTYNQTMTGEEGGCSTTRNHESHEAACRRLQELYPQYVSLIPKQNITGGEFGNRMEVRVRWKEAYAAGYWKDKIP